MNRSTFLSITLGAVILLCAAVSCAKENSTVDPTPDSFFKKEGLTTNWGSDQFEESVLILGGLKEIDRPWARARAGKRLTTSPDEAKIIILGNSVLDANKELLDSAYNEGKFIIVCYPDVNYLRDIRNSMGWTFIIPDNVPKTNFAIGFANHHSILLTPPQKGNTEPIKDDNFFESIDVSKVEFENSSIFSSTRGLMKFLQLFKRHKAKETKTSVTAPSLDATINTNYYSVPTDRTQLCEIRGRYLKVFYGFAFNIEVYPCYVPQNVHNHGDYYVVKATATDFAPTMYEYDGVDSNVPVGKNPFKHYWPNRSGDKEHSYWGDAYFLGPYNKMFNFKCYAQSNTSALKFIERPDPDSYIGTTSYSNTSEFSWNVGVSGGYSQKQGGNFSLNAGVGGSSSNTVSYSMSDIQVLNRSTNNVVEYEFDYQNVPDGPVNIDDYVDYTKMPAISRSTADYEMMWEWTTSDPLDDYDKTILGVKYEIVHQFCISTRDKDGGIWTNYWIAYARQFFFNDPGNESPMRLARVPVGCLHIANACTDNQFLWNISVVDETGQTVAQSINSIAAGEYYEVLLPQKDHSYTVFFNMGKSESETKQYHSINKIELPLLISDSDKRVLTATTAGGDFETDDALLRVKNQSWLKVVRNIVVYRASDNTAVCEFASSLGAEQVAEFQLKSGVEYYVTMEFGSSGVWENFKTEKNFTLSRYKIESDIKYLIVTASGGDFVKI